MTQLMKNENFILMVKYYVRVWRVKNIPLPWVLRSAYTVFDIEMSDLF